MPTMSQKQKKKYETFERKQRNKTNFAMKKNLFISFISNALQKKKNIKQLKELDREMKNWE